ncbi:MAG: hypothetical protein U0P30_09490 [Vicinamibacterales bacterium]
MIVPLSRRASAEPGGTALQHWRFSGNRLLSASRVGRTLYVGGDFDAVAPAANDLGSLAVFGPFATPVPGARLDGTSTALVADGAGGYYVGRSVTVSGSQANILSHVLADGSVAGAFQPAFNGAVTTLTRLGTVLYVGGAFTAANGQARGRGAAFDLASGALLPWNPRVDVGSVDAIADAGPGRVYIGGTFNSVAGVTAIGLLRVTATTGAIDALINVSVPGGSVVTTLLTVGDVMYVGGTFGAIGGFSRNRLAAIDLTTSTVTPFLANLVGASAIVRALAYHGGRLFVGGSFAGVNGLPVFDLAQVDGVTGAVSPWRVRTYDVTALLTVGNTLFVAGRFNRVEGESRAHLAAIDLTGAGNTVLPWNPGLVGEVARLAAGTGGEVAVAGAPLTYGARGRDGIAALDLVTGELLPFAPGLDGFYVSAIDATPSAVYLGGGFVAVNGVTRQGLAAVDPSGRLLPWDPSGAGIFVDAIVAAGPAVFVGGTFAQLGGQLRGNLAKLDAITGLALPWRADANGSVEHLRVAGATVYAAGPFTTIGGQARVKLAGLDMDTGLVRPLAVAIGGGDIRDLRVSSGLLYLAGTFAAVNGQARRYVAAVDAVSGATSPFAPDVDDYVDRIAERDGHVYLAGTFQLVNSAPRAGLAAVSVGTGTTTQPFTPAIARVKTWAFLEPGPDPMIAVAGSPGTGVHAFVDAAMTGAPGPPGVARAKVRGSTLAVDWQPAVIGGPPTSHVLDAATAPGAPAFVSLPVSSRCSPWAACHRHLLPQCACAQCVRFRGAVTRCWRHGRCGRMR